MVTVEERRARLGRRHFLVTPSDDPLEVARGLVAYHATDPASVHIAAAVRTGFALPEVSERALYEERTLVRMHGMRRTMFVVPTELAPVVQAACNLGVAAAQRRRYATLMAKAGVTVDEAWFSEVEDETAQALAARGEATGAELAAAVPRLRTRVLLNQGKRYEQNANITTWVLTLLAADGRIVRVRPNGSWRSSQYRWALAADWLPGGLAPMPVEEARAEVLRRWLWSFGPGTVADLKWWTGWTMGEVKKALALVDVAEVDLEGGETGLVLADDVDSVARPEPWVALLPALDATPMGWAGRDFYLSEKCRAALFDRSGNIGPSVWSDGRIVGGWAQRGDGTIAYRLIEKVGREVRSAVQATAYRLSQWFGGARPTPRFRTPLERELTA